MKTRFYIICKNYSKAVLKLNTYNSLFFAVKMHLVQNNPVCKETCFDIKSSVLKCKPFSFHENENRQICCDKNHSH